MTTAIQRSNAMSLILSALPNKFETGGGGEVLPPAPPFSNYAAKISLNKGSNYGYRVTIPSQYNEGNVGNVGFFFSITGAAHFYTEIELLIQGTTNRSITMRIIVQPDTVQTDKARISTIEAYSRGYFSTAVRYFKTWLWGTTSEKTYGTIPLIEPNKWYYVFASFDVASNTRNSTLDFAKFNGVEFNSNTLGGADPSGYYTSGGYANIEIGLPSRYTANNASGLFAYVYGFTMNWGTAQTLTPPTGYTSWREYSDSMMWWRPEEGGQMPEPLANDHLIRSFTSSSNLTSSDGLIRASYTSFAGQAPTNATVANKYIVEPSSETETNYAEVVETRGINLNHTSSTTFYDLPSVLDKCLVILVFKYDYSYVPIQYYPNFGLDNMIIMRPHNVAGSRIYNFDIGTQVKGVTAPSGTTNGWMCILYYVDSTGLTWCSINKQSATVDTGSSINLVNNLNWQSFGRSTTTPGVWRYIAAYYNEQMTTGAGANVPWADRTAMEGYFYSGGNALKPNLARAVPYIKPIICFDADNPRGFGVVRPLSEKLPDDTATWYNPSSSPTYPTSTSGNLNTGARVTIKRKAGQIIVGAD